MGRGDGWRDAGDRRPHTRALLALLAALILVAAVPPAAGALRDDFEEPIPLLQPSVGGDPRIGGTLTCAKGTWDDSDAVPYTYEYRWLRGDEDNAYYIEDAEAASYVVTARGRGADALLRGRRDRRAPELGGPQRADRRARPREPRAAAAQRRGAARR